MMTLLMAGLLGFVIASFTYKRLEPLLKKRDVVFKVLIGTVIVFAGFNLLSWQLELPIFREIGSHLSIFCAGAALYVLLRLEDIKRQREKKFKGSSE